MTSRENIQDGRRHTGFAAPLDAKDNLSKIPSPDQPGGSADKFLQGSRRLIGLATSFDTEVVLSKVSFLDQIGDSVAKFVKQQASETESFVKNPVHSSAYTVLTNGINDVDKVVQHAAKHIGEQVAMDELLGVFTQSETIHTIAKHARFPEGVLRRALYDNVFSSYDTHTLALGGDSKTLQTTESFDELQSYYPPVLGRGCPLAIPDNEHRLDPLFISFSKWASELSIRALYKSRS